MEAELNSLEDRIKTLAMLCQQLRSENVELRKTVLTLKNDNRRLNDKVEGAKTRVEALLGQLPLVDAQEEAE